jgi:glutathione S-transferase
MWGYWRSSASWRVRLMLGLKDCKFNLNVVNLLKGENKTEEYAQLNPFKVIKLA